MNFLKGSRLKMNVNFIESNFRYLVELCQENDTTIEIEVNRIVKIFKEMED